MLNKLALVFDLDDTLYVESSYFLAIFSVFCANNGWPNGTFSSLIENFHELRFTQANIFGYFLDLNDGLLRSGAGDNVHKTRELYMDELFSLYTGLKTKLEPTNGVVEWLDFARRRNMKVGVLTNGIPLAQRNKWSCLNIADKSLISLVPARECGCEKPHPEAFNCISRRLGVDINHIVFLGDRFENDLAYPFSQGANCILLGNETFHGVSDERLHVAADLKSAYLHYISHD